MTRTVRDAALLLQAMAGPDERDPLSIDNQPEDYLAACDGDLKGLRVVYSADFGYAAVDKEVRALTAAAARRFGDLGARVEERDPGWPDPGDFHKVIYEVSVGSRQVDRATERPDWIEATLMQMIENARRVSAIEHGKALLARSTFYQQHVLPFFQTCDLLLTPQMPLGAWSKQPGPHEGPREIDGRPMRSMFDRLPFTYPFNLTGQPAATVPCGFTSEGLPVGLQIVGRWHADGQVLRAAAGFERSSPGRSSARRWTEHRPGAWPAPKMRRAGQALSCVNRLLTLGLQRAATLVRHAERGRASLPTRPAAGARHGRLPAAWMPGGAVCRAPGVRKRRRPVQPGAC